MISKKIIYKDKFAAQRYKNKASLRNSLKETTEHKALQKRTNSTPARQYPSIQQQYFILCAEYCTKKNIVRYQQQTTANQFFLAVRLEKIHTYLGFKYE